jgi:hypothetical protein
MKNNSKKLVVTITHGAENEISTDGFTVANGGLANILSARNLLIFESNISIIRGNFYLNCHTPFLL